MKTQKNVCKKLLRYSFLLVLFCILTFFCHAKVYAAVDSKANVDHIEGTTEADVDDPDAADDFSLNINSSSDGTSMSATIKMIVVLTVIAVAPFLLLMVTSFTRIIVVLHFLRSALGTQTTPPNQVLIGIALFLTIFIMSPVFTQINEDCIQPYEAGEFESQEDAINAGLAPLRTFMFEQTNRKDLELFLKIEGQTEEVSVESVDEIKTSVLIPSFMISELRTAFIIGFMIYLPFIVIDMVVASTLMSMGMMMLPPTTISMPFKILLFVLADGWNLVIGQVVKTFY